jgi:hypothetical protein
MKKYLTTNTKLKKDGIYAFNLPPMLTCPCAGECKAYCYAKKGFYNMPSVKKGLAKRLKLTKDKVDFICSISTESKSKGFVRIHASGDFYSLEYLKCWTMIAACNPLTRFYCYTKSVGLVKDEMKFRELPSNLRVIFSYGGTEDALIDPIKDRHCRIFETKAALEAAGYVDVSNSDLIAATTSSLKIGIVKH